MDWGKLFFSAYGRIGRGDFWISIAILFGAGILLGWIFPLGLVVLYSNVCVKTKRLHDMGRSGWLQLIPIVGYLAVIIFTIYFVVAAIATGANWHNLSEVVATVGLAVGGVTLGLSWLAAILLHIGFLLWMGFSEPQPFDNEYGPMIERQLTGGMAPA